MKSKFKRIFAVLMALSMIVSLLPAQFALADDTTGMSGYITYGTEKQLKESSYKGHVFQLEEVKEAAYNYKLTVSVYNTNLSSTYLTTLSYDHDNVVLVKKETSTVCPDYTTSAQVKNVMNIGSVTADMIGVSDYLDEDLTDNLFYTWMFDHGEIGDSSGRYKVKTILELANDLTASEWTNASSGALYSKPGQFAAYRFPSNQLITLYTMYFKLQDGKTGITDTTFTPIYEDLEGYHGAATSEFQSDGKALYQDDDEGVYLIGFPTPQVADQTVNFTKVQDKDGNGLNGATIKIYNDSAKAEENLAKTITTGSDGKASTTLPANTTYYYTVSLSGYQDATGYFQVGSAAATVDTIQLTSNADVKYDTTITVKDADTGNPLAGATVQVDGTSLSNTTDSNGQTTGKFTATSHGAVASLTGYQTSQTVNFNVSSTGTNAATISLVPERASVTLPTVKDDKGGTVSGAKVTVTKTSANATNEWGTTNTYDAGATVNLPKDTEYKMTIAAGGYSSRTIYLVVNESGTTAYYSDSAHLSAISADDVTITKLSDPYYQVNVTQNESDKTKFTAEVTLNNISGTYGTFGLKYDKDVFTFDEFTLENSTEIGLFNPDPTAPENANVEIQSGDGEIIGYHVFSWRSLNEESGEPFDATSGKKVATYTFTLKSGKSEKDITSDAFSVMPYDKTSAGVAYIAGTADISEAREYLDGLWRYTDSKNTADNLGTGRLEESKATLNGFNQVFVNSTDGTEDATCTFDVMTNVAYTNFEAAKASLNFIVTDKDNVPLDNATVKLCDSTGNPLTTLTTDSTGIVCYPVSGTASYQYSVSCPGYWDEPETGLTSVTVQEKTTVNEIIKLEQKIYHTPVLQYSNGTEVPADVAAPSGDKFAYNNRDYHFYIKPAPGKQIQASPTLTFVVIVKGTDGAPDQTYTPVYDSASNTYKLEAAKITGTPTNNTPDINGFPSEDIIIKITDGGFEDSNDKYTVTAHAGTHGSVAYDQDSTSYSQDESSTASDITVSSITPNDSIGKFTFTADSNYKVEKVIVNGVQIHNYDNLTTFDYSFGNITADNDITVTFWDGIHPSDDAVVTLVVGPNGEANVTNPETTDPVRNTRKTYLYTGAGTLDFTLTADSGHSVNSVEKSVNGGENETVTGTPYSVPVAVGDVTTVYVTFDTSTMFVNAGVKSGEGTISPVGVIIANMYDSLTFTMNAKDTDWAASAVDVNGTVVNNSVSNSQTYTYTVQSITQNTSVGAIFTETSYKVTGHVDLSQGKNLTTIAVQSPAIVTCTRPSDGMVVIVQTTKSRTDATFEAPLPKGTWNIKISKVGYINYTITGFEVDGTSDVTFGKKSDESIQKITPYIGNTSGTGKTVSLTDAGVVSNGLRTAASAATKAKADVDDDGDVSATSDMAYIKFNYGQRSVTETYADFLAH